MRKLLLVPVVAVICAGCALGPDYRRPDVEAPRHGGSRHKTPRMWPTPCGGSGSATRRSTDS